MSRYGSLVSLEFLLGLLLTMALIIGAFVVYTNVFQNDPVDIRATRTYEGFLDYLQQCLSTEDVGCYCDHPDQANPRYDFSTMPLGGGVLFDQALVWDGYNVYLRNLEKGIRIDLVRFDGKTAKIVDLRSAASIPRVCEYYLDSTTTTGNWILNHESPTSLQYSREGGTGTDGLGKTRATERMFVKIGDDLCVLGVNSEKAAREQFHPCGTDIITTQSGERMFIVIHERVPSSSSGLFSSGDWFYEPETRGPGTPPYYVNSQTLIDNLAGELAATHTFKTTPTDRLLSSSSTYASSFYSGSVDSTSELFEKLYAQKETLIGAGYVLSLMVNKKSVDDARVSHALSHDYILISYPKDNLLAESLAKYLKMELDTLKGQTWDGELSYPDGKSDKGYTFNTEVLLKNGAVSPFDTDHPLTAEIHRVPIVFVDLVEVNDGYNLLLGHEDIIAKRLAEGAKMFQEEWAKKLQEGVTLVSLTP